MNDLRFAFRMLARRPSTTAIAILALAIGIGVTTAGFSVVDAVLVSPLPYEGSDRLYILQERDDSMELSVAWPNFVDWRDGRQAFESMAAARRDSVNLTGVGDPERLQAREVSHDFFETLRVTPVAGREIAPEDDRPGAAPVAVLAHGLWARRFGSDPTVVGSTISLDGRPTTIVGILPEDFEYLSGADLYVPIGRKADDWTDRRSHPGIFVLARLAPGATEEGARAELDAIAARLARDHPESNEKNRIVMKSLHEAVVGDARTPLVILFGAVAFVLLVACANVANLLLARSSSRQREIAIRSALGARRGRIVRQLLVESVALGVAGGALGCAVAVWCVDLLVAVWPDAIPRASEVGVDARALAFAAAISVGSSVLFGLAPALRLARGDVNEALKRDGTRTAGAAGGRRALSTLVVVEIALAVVLSVGAGLTIESFRRLGRVDPGFDAGELLTLRLAVAPGRYDGPAAAAFLERARERIASLPGVECAAYSYGFPLVDASEEAFTIEGRDDLKLGDTVAVLYLVSRGYDEALGLRLKRGRFLSSRDTRESSLAVVVDENFARRYFPNEDPIGRRIHALQFEPDAPPYEIVGVVEPVTHYALDGEGPVDAQFYIAFDQLPVDFVDDAARNLSVVARTDRDPASVAAEVRTELLALDPEQPVFDVKPVRTLLDDARARDRFVASLLGAFAAAALLLAAIGIYGVTSYAVGQRTREIGVRMALGATGRDVLAMVLKHGAAMALAGVALGTAGALALSRVLSGLLFEVSATDPATFAAVACLLTAVALAACYVPARRATRVDPVEALRGE